MFAIARGLLSSHTVSINVFYIERMVAESESFSPNAHESREAMKSWQALDLPLEIVAPEAVGIDQLALAYDRSFVEQVLSGQRDNGFGNRSPAVAEPLPSHFGNWPALWSVHLDK